MKYNVSNEGIAALRKDAAALSEAAGDMSAKVRNLRGGIEDYSGRLGVHESNLLNVIDEIASELSDVDQEVEDISNALNEVADGYQEVLDSGNIFGPDTESAGQAALPQNRSGVVVNGQRYRTDDGGNIYAVKNPDTGRYELMPNKSYSLNGYDYKTDSNGRIYSVEGKLRLKKGKRAALNDTVPGMTAGDERGHLIADIFDGANNNGNLVAMGFDLNRSDFRRLEETWAAALDNKADVRVNIKPVYNAGDNKRPRGLLVSYTINGKPKTAYLRN